jgi:hypothetical protein
MDGGGGGESVVEGVLLFLFLLWWAKDNRACFFLPLPLPLLLPLPWLVEWLLLPGTNEEEEEETDTVDEEDEEDEEDEDAANVGAPLVARLFALSRWYFLLFWAAAAIFFCLTFLLIAFRFHLPLLQFQ